MDLESGFVFWLEGHFTQVGSTPKSLQDYKLIDVVGPVAGASSFAQQGTPDVL